MSNDYVFISYSQNDAHEARELANSLLAKDTKVWIDLINLADLQPGQDEEELIEKAILSSKLMAIVTSPNALTDSFLKDEKQFARDNDKDVVLVKIAACNLNKKMRWRRLPCVDLISDRTKGLATLLDKLGGAHIKPSVSKTIEPKIVPLEKVVNTPTNSSEILKNLIKELRDDISLYELNINNQIKNSYLGVKLLIACSVILLLSLYLVPDLKAILEGGEDNLKYLPPIGGMIPSSLSSFSLNKIKEKKKRLSSLKSCDRKLSRIESGLIDYSKEDILGIEDELFKYINA